MHPEVCSFISDAVYDSRLEPQANNVKRVLVLHDDALPLLKPAGIVFVPIDHSACSLQSQEEALLIKQLYEDLLRQRYTANGGSVRPMKAENILVVARVGTVDKFQGREAEVVLISMTTSSEAELPRFIEFLFSKNRLNVAVSRAKSLAVLVANPALTSIKCTTPAQMGLVNTLCWIASVGRAAASAISCNRHNFLDRVDIGE